MAYADYSYYTTTYGGNAISSSDFTRLAERSSDYIDYLTFGKAKTMDDDDRVKKCCCAIAEKIALLDSVQSAVTSGIASAVENGGEITSETVGEWSVSKKSGLSAAESAKSYQETVNKEMSNIARRYLLSTGLLYRGACFNGFSAHCNDL